MNEPLHILFDVSAVPYGRGISRYTSNLAGALAARSDVRLRLFGRSFRQRAPLKSWMEAFGPSADHLLWPVPPRPFYPLWQKLQWPTIEWIDKKADVYHAWDWQLAPISKVPQVVTIHDLAYKLFPETAHPEVVAQYDHLIAQLEKTDWPVITVSTSSKNDIVNLTNIAVDRVHVVPEALPEEARVIPSPSEMTDVLARFNLRKPYLFFIGTTEPRKNLSRIVEAWKKVRDRFDLVVAGAEGWDVREQAAGIHYIGYVDGVTSASLYRQAHALVYTSLYEGFGLPILEAYFHGCPVITSRLPVFEEVSGGCASLVDPYNAGEIAQAALTIEDPQSKARAKRRADMLVVLNNYSWQKAAQETTRVYRIAAQR